MNDAAAVSRPKIRRTDDSTIRGQLLGASLFPLAFFGLLSILVTAAALYDITTKLVSERNAAEVHAAALTVALAQRQSGSTAARLPFQRPSDSGRNEQMLLVGSDRRVLSSLGAAFADTASIRQVMAGMTQQSAPLSISLTSPVSQDQIIISAAPVPGTQDVLILAEPWSLAMTPALSYQAVLVGLLLCGTLLSLLMLSVRIGRVMEPIRELAATAGRAVPGSIFHPVPERGPVELRSLTAAFNQMVIQLAEQQAAVREYARKALLSQEEERQRLSHELHDGTVQDLVGLAQRLELCRSEMDSNPVRARQRLDELRNLSQQALAEARRISNALRPSILQDLGLAAALRALCHELEQTMAGVRCDCRLDPDNLGDKRLPSDLELAVFRVAQEALSNIRRHAGRVTTVCVSFRVSGDSAQLEVRDDGHGMGEPDFSQLVRDGHLGIAGMQERARLFGGKVEVSSEHEKGTSVRMILPLQLGGADS